ncbi:Armadillo-type fold,Domain of unknown function DUF2428, death-receptor-like,Armadillo-like helical [Cinara cedri]|uniref:tRNA (32-2'-O)-methyltransferase regulator THADA n=1 Tax=Cinara cedri TaxID=506608 RepID=A0A5E4MDT3_9HEMI|nr:Armadillo-type fold,Domain of unknown function DUF2428, death-receptor-like,Armadillo-like helical [Cinara cedri]
MSALNLRNVKRDFAQLNYRPDICHPNLIKELKYILEITGLKQEYDTVLSNLNTHSLISIIQHVCKVCYSDTDTLSEEIANDLVRFLAIIYTEHCIDDKVKRAVTKCLKSCPEKWQPELSSAITYQFMIFLEKGHNQSEAEYFLKTLNECSEHFPTIIFNSIKKFLAFFELTLKNSYNILVCESSPTQKISAIRCIHEGFRFYLTAYKKKLLPEAIGFTSDLHDCFVVLLDCDHLPMETIFNCCLSILYTHRKYGYSSLAGWDMCMQKLATHTDLVKLGFCDAILNTFTCKELKLNSPKSEEPIFISLYNSIVNVSIRNLNNSSISLSSSRVLLVFTKRMKSITAKNMLNKMDKNKVESLIDFLWARMDHILDGVRHMTRETMVTLLKVKDENVFIKVLERLSLSDQNSKGFFIVLTLLSNQVDSRLVIKYLPNIADTLLHLMCSNNSATTVFINLMLNHYTTTECKLWFDYWLYPLFKNTAKLDVKHFEQIMAKAVELSPDVSKYLYDLSNQNDLALKIYLVCFNVEKKRYLANYNNGNWMSSTNIDIIKKALHSNDENTRFSAVHLILDCHKKTQPFTENELELIKYFITYNIKHEKPSIKQTNLSFIKKTLLRIKESQFSATVRNNESLNITVTKYYTDFQQWFSKFCFDNLFPDATFSRRNFSLESLCLIQTCLSPTGIIGLNESNNITLLLNRLWDTYEQNKILAKNILVFKNQEPIKLDNTVIEDMLKTSKILASSTSPPDCITAGYLLEVVIFLQGNKNCEDYTYVIIVELINNLKKEVALAEESLTLASANGPMYGLIHTIRHLLNTLNWKNYGSKNNWTTCIEDLSSICLKCEKLVSIVVNDSSPEGIIPMDDLYQNDSQVTSQMVLLCCWRTAKEASLLLSDIVGIITIQESEFNNTLITKICSCLTLSLAETKHRGAFEQIYVAYLKVCSTMWKSPALHKIPLKYLEDVLTEIKTGLNETFCVTRRSAGMPFIIQALICTNHDKRQIVNHTMETLITICNNSESLEAGVVHALNVLRALFRCSQLGDLVGLFLSRAINISIVLFNSSSWPIRNSSTLLLSALVNRVFGVPRSSTEISWKNRMTGREFFERYPELYITFLNEFKKFSPMDMRPSLYPTLLLLARLYPSANEATECIYQLSVYIPYIFKCAQSPVMKTRMLAATSIAPQVTQIELVKHIFITFNELTNKNLNENTKHGLLLQVFSLVENLPKLESNDLSKLVRLTENLSMKYNQFNNCSYVVKEVFLRCITCLWLQLDKLHYNYVEPIYTSTLETITKYIKSNDIGRSKYLESAILFLFSISLKAQTDFSIVVYNVMKSKMQCEIIFEVLSIILSEKPIEFCDHLDKFKNLKYWNRQVLMNQLLANKILIELVCQQCTIIDSLIHVKYLVLSNFTPALVEYFKVYEPIDNFISKVFCLRRDIEISQALLCINGYLQTQKLLEQSVTIKLIQIFENIYYGQRSDDCKNACVDIIIDNYNLLIENNLLDIKTFLKLWTIMIHYSEDNSEKVRNHVWRLVNQDANCIKSSELLFDKFAEHFNQFPSAVFTALICWSYLDVELPQDRLEGQVFDGGDTSEYKELTIRQNLALKIIMNLTNSYPSQSMDLEINKHLQEWITEEWTSEFDVKPKIEDLKTVGNFNDYAKGFYSKISGLIKKHN